MLLQDLNINADLKIDKINQFLSLKYGTKISDKTDDATLSDLKDRVSNRIQHLRVKEGLTPKDSELIKEMLILEGITSLVEYRATQHQELAHGPYRRMLDDLSEEAVHLVQIGDSYDDAINTCMKKYRSSMFRFDDSMVKQDLENRVKDFLHQEYIKLTTEEQMENMITDSAEATAPDVAQNDIVKKVKQHALKRLVKEIESWSSDLGRSVAATWNGHSENIVRDALDPIFKQINDKRIDRAQIEGDLIRLVSDKINGADDVGPDDLGTIELDEYDYRRDAPVDRKDREDISKEIKDKGAAYLAKKGTPELSLEPKSSGTHGRATFVHPRIKKEEMNMTESRDNYIKRLRNILESEVVQAEVLIAAKGFGQEIQLMIEKIGRLMNEDLGPVVDQMREAYGPQEADAFQSSMRSEMEATLDNLRNVKEKIDGSVQQLAAGSVPGTETDMDVDPTGVDPDLGIENTPSDLDAELDGGFEDEFGGAEDAPLGRPQKESVDFLKAEIKKLRENIAKKRK